MHIEFGVSRQIVSRWENGDAIPRATKVKTICDEFNMSPEILLGNENTNEKAKELGEKTKNELNLKSKRMVKITIMIIIFLLLLYFIYFMYKFIIITKINSIIEKSDNWSNYFAEIKTYEDAKQISKIDIWYKDNKYKVTEEYYNSINEKIESTSYINLNEKTRIDVTNGIVKEYGDKYTEDISNDGKKIIKYFPWVYDIKNNKIKICFNSILYAKKEKEGITIKNGKKTLKLKSDWTTPVSYSDSELEKITFMDFNIEFDKVKDNNLEIKEDL